MKTGFYDAHGTEYETGDLVLNPLFCDIWLVDEYTPEDGKEPDDPPYCLKLYGVSDIHVMPIDEPCDFEILKRKSDPDYSKTLEKCHEYAKKWMNETQQ